jgi:hypothetical protein
MSTAPVTVNFAQASPGYFQQRRADLKQLSQDLESGNLSGAQQDYTSLQSLAQSGPFGGDAFQVSGRQQDFAAIGTALQSGNISAAQQAFAQLQSTFQPQAPPVPAPQDQPTANANSGSEIVLNLGNLTPGEQININLATGSNGSEQVTIGVANQPGASPEQITLNLNPSGNQEIVLNLFNANGSTTSSSPSGNGLSLQA